MGRSDTDNAEAHNAELVIDPQVERLLKLNAFEKGFARGSDALKRGTRHTVDAATHEHWRKGFDAGRRALEELDK